MSVDAALFGTTDGAPGMLATAQDGVFIIEDAHLLPLAVQEKLKFFVSRRKAKSNSGKILSATRTRLILTALPSFGTQEFITGFEKVVAQFIITLPRFEEMLGEARQLVEFLFARAVNRRPLKPERGLVREIVDRISAGGEHVTLRSLVLAIETATNRAADEGRQAILRSDFGAFEDLYDTNVSLTPKDMRELVLASDDKIGVAPWRQLYEVIRTGSFADAEDVVRKMMVEYATIRYRGNKTKVAAQLGVARQHLYKPALREFHPNGIRQRICAEEEVLQ